VRSAIVKQIAARKIAESLWNVGELYHSGAIEYDEFDRRNKTLWRSVEDIGVDSLVKSELRKAR
jgi:hypothetical protein